MISNNGATLEDMPELEAGLAGFEALNARLGRDAFPLVWACRDFYALWALYLSSLESFADFADCIKKNRAYAFPGSRQV